MNYYLDAFKKYAVFSGRAGKKEFWYFVIINVIVAFLLSSVEGILRPGMRSGTSIFAAIYNLVAFVPTLAVGFRRMHDLGAEGWHFFIPVYNLIQACKEGTRGPNRFGEDPREIENKQ